MHIFVLLTMSIFSFSALSLSVKEKIEGFLVGTFYGDAYSGPHEFKSYNSRDLELTKYKVKGSAFGTFKDFAPKGSVTDDSRLKIYFLKSFLENNKKLTPFLFEREIIKNYHKDDEHSGLRRTWLSQFYKLSTRIIQPNKQVEQEMFFAGLPTILGQVTFSPLAIIYPNNQSLVYKTCWEINNLDNGTAKDINCSLIAALSTLFSEKEVNLDYFINKLISFDPFDIQNTPYIGRPLNRWIKISLELSRKSYYSDNHFLSKLQREVNATYWWEDYAGLAVPLTILKRKENDPSSILPLINKFGKDSDSYSQLSAGILGALYGVRFFPKEDVKILKSQLIQQHQFDIDKVLNDLF